MLERVGLLPWDIALIQTVDITDHWDTWRKYISFHSNIEYILMLHQVRIMAGENCDKDVCVCLQYTNPLKPSDVYMHYHHQIR